MLKVSKSSWAGRQRMASILGLVNEKTPGTKRVLVATALILVPVIFYLPSLFTCPTPPQLPPLPVASMTVPTTPSPWSDASHLIMVAGHAVLTAAHHTQVSVQSEDAWYLEPFQHGQLKTMLTHIKRGVELASEDNSSLLVFSGGETRAAAGPRSEAASYWEAAEAMSWYGHAARVRQRALLEVHARDSFENLLFAICRFREAAGRYPTRGALTPPRPPRLLTYSFSLSHAPHARAARPCG